MPHKDIQARTAYQRTYRQRTSAIRSARRPDDDRARHANERARLYGAPGIIGIDVIREVMAAGTCHYCGTPERLGIDHVIPLHSGGVNERANLVPCCHSCNISKGRGTAPGRWSQTVDACRRCATTSRRHSAHGLCGACYQHMRKYRPEDLLSGEITRNLR